MAILGIFGQQGEGKTATLVEWLKSHYDAGYLPVTNVSASFPHIKAEYAAIEMARKQGIPLARMYNSQKPIALGIDEILTWMGARSFGSEANKLLAEFISQLAKNNITMAYTAQLVRMADVILEEQTNDMLVSEKVSVKLEGTRYILGFEQTKFRVKDGEEDSRFWTVEQAEPFFNMYDRGQNIAKLNTGKK